MFNYCVSRVMLEEILLSIHICKLVVVVSYFMLETVCLILN